MRAGRPRHAILRYILPETRNWKPETISAVLAASGSMSKSRVLPTSFPVHCGGGVATFSVFYQRSFAFSRPQLKSPPKKIY